MIDHAAVVQGSDAWKKIRCGKATGSRIADIVARTKTGYSTSRANYAAELIAERLTGTPTEGFQSAAMKWGSDTEPQARECYELMTDSTVEQVGFIEHPRIAMSGASPDGLVGTDGLVEFKCPLTATHIDTLLGASIPGGYISQVQWQLGCTGRQWCDWVSFDPRMPGNMCIFIKRIARDDTLIASLELDVHNFLVEIDRKVAELTKKYGPTQKNAA